MTDSKTTLNKSDLLTAAGSSLTQPKLDWSWRFEHCKSGIHLADYCRVFSLREKQLGLRCYLP